MIRFYPADDLFVRTNALGTSRDKLKCRLLLGGERACRLVVFVGSDLHNPRDLQICLVRREGI